MKPLYKILIIVIVILVLGVAVYFLWQKFTETPIQESGTGNREPVTSATTTEIKTENGVMVKKISDVPVFDFVAAQNTKDVFYFTEEGLVYLARTDKDEEIAKQAVAALNFIESSPRAASGQKALVAFGDPLAPQWGIFDFVDKVWRPLPNDIGNATWGKNDTTLIGTRKNGGEFNLVTMDISKTPPVTQTLIKDFRFKDVNFIFKPPQSLLIIEKPSASYESRVWELNLDPKKLTFNLLMQGKNGLMLNFANDKSTAFQFVAPDEFRILDAQFQERTPLFFTTLPSKCALDAAAQIVYCFAPQDFPPELPNLTLPDDYLQNRFRTTDTLYKIDLATDDVSNVFTSGSGDFPPMDAKNPAVRDGKIYFVNKYDNYLYEISNLDI